MNIPFASIVLKKSRLLAESQHWVGRARLPSSGRRLRDQDQLGELAEVLGGGGEEELVLGTIRAPQAQAVKLQDTLEVGEQHLDLLPLAAGREIGVGQRQTPSEIACALVDRAQDLAGRPVGRAALLEAAGV